MRLSSPLKRARDFVALLFPPSSEQLSTQPRVVPVMTFGGEATLQWKGKNVDDLTIVELRAAARVLIRKNHDLVPGAKAKKLRRAEKARRGGQ